MANLFKEVIAKSLVSDVNENLSLLLKINQNENLLPIFVSFMNTSDNVPLTYSKYHTQTLATHINIIIFLE